MDSSTVNNATVIFGINSPISIGTDNVLSGGKLSRLLGEQERHQITSEPFQRDLLSDRSHTHLKLEHSDTSLSFDHFSSDRNHLLVKRSNIPELNSGKFFDNHADR